MIPAETQVILCSGEALSAAEIFEGLLLLALHQSVFPILSERDKAQAVIHTAFDALDWAKENA